MKLSLILEAKLNRAWLEKRLGKENPVVQKIVDTDPTDGSYYEWLTSIYLNLQSDEYLTPELRADVAEWDQNKQAIKNAGLSSDLKRKDLRYFNDTLEKAKQYKAIKASTTHNSGVYHLFKEYPGADVLLNDGTYILFEIKGTDEAAVDSLKKLGIGTAWCTRTGGNGDDFTEHYLSQSPTFVLYKIKNHYINSI
jgi:hypothetical protein